MFVHCVYFWLRADLSPAEHAAFRAGVRSLAGLESVVQSHMGPPAGTARPVIDSSYSWALIAVFRDQQGHDAYQVHPVHDAFRANCASFWTRVQIYDVNTSDAAS